MRVTGAHAGSDPRIPRGLAGASATPWSSSRLIHWRWMTPAGAKTRTFPMRTTLTKTALTRSCRLKSKLTRYQCSSRCHSLSPLHNRTWEARLTHRCACWLPVAVRARRLQAHRPQARLLPVRARAAPRTRPRVTKASDTRSAASWMTNLVDILTPIFTYYHFVFCHCAPTHTSTSFNFSQISPFFCIS
jgi:hypothetical protein